MPKKNSRRLTDAGVQKIKLAPKGKRKQHFDAGEPGLALQVTDKGTKSWLCYFYLGDNHCKLTLGRWPDIGVASAREKARNARALARLGTDPRETQKAERNKQRHSLSAERRYGRVVDDFVKYHARPRQKSWAETERVLRSVPWTDRPVTSITKSDAYDLLEGLINDGHQQKARVTRSWLKTFFNWAAKRDIVATSPMQNVDIEIERSVRKRFYTDDEIKKVWTAANDLAPIEGGFVKLTILLAVRKNELAGMRRGEFDNRDKPTLWTIPHTRTKTKKSTTTERVYIVPLPKLAQRIVRNLIDDSSDIVFPGDRDDRTYIPDQRLARKIREGSGVQDWAYHANRDTAATWLENQGHSKYERGLVLNHAESGVTADYSHGYPVELKRTLMKKWANHVASVVQPRGAVLLS